MGFVENYALNFTLVWRWRVWFPDQNARDQQKQGAYALRFSEEVIKLGNYVIVAINLIPRPYLITQLLTDGSVISARA